MSTTLPIPPRTNRRQNAGHGSVSDALMLADVPGSSADERERLWNARQEIDALRRSLSQI